MVPYRLEGHILLPVTSYSKRKRCRLHFDNGSVTLYSVFPKKQQFLVFQTILQCMTCLNRGDRPWHSTLTAFSRVAEPENYLRVACRRALHSTFALIWIRNVTSLVLSELLTAYCLDTRPFCFFPKFLIFKFLSFQQLSTVCTLID